MLSTNHLDESIKAWVSARKRIDRDKDPRMADWVDGRLRWARYGKVSMKRDRVYSDGQGDLPLALKLMDKQLEIYPKSPVLHFDRATAQIMVSEFMGAASNATKLAVKGFADAQEAAFHAWKAGLKERGRSGPECDDKGAIVYDWTEPRGALVSIETVTELTTVAYGTESAFQDKGAYVARFENVGISGDDGVIVDESRCQVFMASAGSVVNLAQNMQMLEIWTGPPTPYADGPEWKWYDHSWGSMPNHGAQEKPVALKKAASIVQFAGKSYFHTITELFGRLWLLKRHGVFEDPEVRLVVPQPSGFLGAGLEHLLSGTGIGSNRRVYWANGQPDVRLRIESLFYANWMPPAPLGADGGHCSTPRSVLSNVRMNLLSLSTPAKKVSRGLVFIKRPPNQMRSDVKGGPELQRKLREACDLTKGEVKFELFDGTLKPQATVKLFSRALLVVGVHGGALTNILFSPSGAELFELGFQTPFASHYRHLAAALDLKYTLLPLVANNRGIGSNKVEIADVDACTKTVVSAIDVRGSDKSGQDGSEL
eukprot:TRINITY_DN64619_c0_g1_i1.p1 TRINITY_DN64619_c0_g1~~TRINITY_DN64619_c0_g1_i1.p1  ORF type:complete len:635 (+),score=62.32 TRINITY_DN64619_c0_g1_i1:288-1907(+)